MRKQIISILLVFSLVMPVIFQIGLLFYHKSEVKKEIRRSLEEVVHNDDLVLMEFSDIEIHSQLKWEHEHEFMYQGEMYDVVYREQQGDKHLLWCYHDRKEKEIKEKITQFFAFGFQDDVQKNDSQKKLLQFYSGLYFYKAQIKLLQTQSTKELFIPESFNLIHTNIAPPVPPPKIG